MNQVEDMESVNLITAVEIALRRESYTLRHFNKNAFRLIKYGGIYFLKC